KQDSIKQNRARLLAEASGYQLELAEAHQEQAKLRLQLQVLSNEKSDLISRQNHLLAEKQALQAERDRLLSAAGNSSDSVKTTTDQNIASLTTMIDDLSGQRNQLERELNETRLALGEAQNRIAALKLTSSSEPSEPPNGESQKQGSELSLSVIQE